MAAFWTEIETAIKENRREIVLKGDEDHVEYVFQNDGMLPTRLFDMKLVNFLDITALPISELQEQLGNLVNLTQLSIKQTDLTLLPNSICDLTSLKLLNVSESLLEELPDNIGNLTSLHSLNVSSNKLTEFPESISDCSALSVVNFSKNSFTEFPLVLTSGPASEKIAEVNGSFNEVSEIDDSIQNISMLKILNLSHNKITEMPQAVAKCIKLKQVDFKTNSLKDKRLKKLIEQDNTAKAILDYIRSKGRPLKSEAIKASTKSKTAKSTRKKLKDEKSEALNNHDDLVKHFLEVVRISDDPWTEEGEPFRVTITENVQKVRPFIVACVLKNLDLNKTTNMFKNFITVQTRLHEDICGKRTLATIATHDMDKLKGSSLVYDALPSNTFRIRPLGRKSKIVAESFYNKLYQEAETARKESKRNQITGIYKYLSLLKDEHNFANLRRTSDNCIISLPPLTNCEETKISADSTDIFVEVTGSKSLDRCKEVMDELLKQLVERGYTSEVTATEKCDEEDSNETSSSPSSKLIVQQVRCEDEKGNVKVIYPSRVDLAFNTPEIKVIRS